MRPTFRWGDIIEMSGAAAAAEEVFREINVEGDGNCFYRSLFKAAKYHPDKDVFGRVLDCFDIELAPVAAAANSNSNSNSSSEGKGRSKSKSKAKTKKARAKAKVVTDEAEENAFCTAIRTYIVASIFEDPYFTGIYETWHKAAKEEPEVFQSIMDETSFEISEPFVDRDEESKEIIEYYPDVMKNMNMADFLGLLASIISNEGVYASETEYSFIKQKLDICGITLMSIDLLPDRPDNVPKKLGSVIDERPVLIVRRMRNSDHYRGVLENNQYMLNKAKIYIPPSKSAPKSFTLSSLLKGAATKQAKSMSKSRKGKGAGAASGKSRKAASSSNNENLAAAIAASLENK